MAAHPIRHPATTRTLPAEPAGEPAREHADGEHRDRRGQQHQAGPGDARAEPVAGGGGRLHELGQERERRVHPHADQQRDQVVRPHGRPPHHLHVDQRRGRAQLGQHPGRRQHDRRGQQAEHPARAPAPVRRLAQRDQQRDQPRGQQHRGQPADPAGGPHRRLGDEQHRRHGGDDREDHRQPEQPVVAQHVHDRAGQDDAEARPDRGQRGEHADRAGHFARPGTHPG